MIRHRYCVVDAGQFAAMVLAGEARLPWMPSDGGVELCRGWTVAQTVADWLCTENKAYDRDHWYCIGKGRDGLYRIIGCDGGDLEDQTLVRDWSWVAAALDSAYEDGRSAHAEAEVVLAYKTYDAAKLLHAERHAEWCSHYKAMTAKERLGCHTDQDSEARRIDASMQSQLGSLAKSRDAARDRVLAKVAELAGDKP